MIPRLLVLDAQVSVASAAARPVAHQDRCRKTKKA
jgi:hypothetical protein